MEETRRLDLDAVRARLKNKQGKEYWRSLDELAETPEFEELVHREFPRQASVWTEDVSRRQFLKIMGASLALAGLAACSPQPLGKIVPYVKQPEQLVPGKPLFFATAMLLSGYATGLLVASYEGRPTKVEGNPNHPASLGAADTFAQASILSLYDPDRSQALTNQGAIRTRDAFLNQFRLLLEGQRGRQGAGLRILTETVSSPTLADEIRNILKAFPSAKWHQWEPNTRDSMRAGAQMAFGQYVETRYQIDKADVILSLDGDFLGSMPGSLRYGRDFAARRRPPGEGSAAMNRLYVIEATPSLTGAKADHRLPVRASDIEAYARAIAAALGLQIPGTPPTLPPQHTAWIAALARDLQAHRGTSLVIAGDSQPAAVHALAHAMNDRLGSVGHTLVYTDPVEANPVDQMASLKELVSDMDAGRVDMLMILGGNPVFSAPADLAFGDKLKKVGYRLHLGLYEDETSALCHWHIPEAHYLEAWGDGRAFDGTVSVIQPLILPLYSGMSAVEFLALFTNPTATSGLDILRAYWSGQNGKPGGIPQQSNFDLFWRTSLHDGVMAGTALPPKNVTLKPDWSSGLNAAPTGGSNQALEIVFRPDPYIYDGRFANNGWLQELPKPISHLTWDSVATVSYNTAQRLGLQDEDMVELAYKGRTLRAPVLIQAAQADNSVTVYTGYGRTRAGRVGTGVGFNAYTIWTSDAPSFGQGVQLAKTSGRYTLATTRAHHMMEGRDLVRSAALAEYQKNPKFAQEPDAAAESTGSIYPGYQYEGNKWGMAIDLSSCIGCNACVVACQAENNIPIVGKTDVERGREMHWLRVDTYFKGELENPEIYFEPVPCMQCETAPCELVCPVMATSHSDEGLNDMTYNRCVGTRYCSNNCPYKVRRFNFLSYSDWDTVSLKLQRNPNVTVRSRGVMEKCTYCVQRITAGRVKAEEEGRKIRDGEVVTACQATCPTQAIVFGDLNDPNSQVSKLKASDRNYALLAELNTHPRTTYLAALRNPNPEIKEG